MADDPGVGVSLDSGELSFDRAEFYEGAKAPTCSLCDVALARTYYEIDGAMACSTCRDGAASQVTRGTRPRRFLRALAAGSGAAVVGAGIYYAVLALTGYEVGLIAIVVGLLVGGAVRWGAYGRGGWIYQGLAIALTYAAIVSTYVPLIFESARVQDRKAAMEAAQAEEVAAAAAAIDPAPATEMAPAVVTAALPPVGQEGSSVTVAKALPPADTTSGTAVDVEPPPSLASAALALALFAGFVLAVPFLAGFDNILGLLIISFALYEAWKLNRKRQRVIVGPFQLADRDGEVDAMPTAAPAPG